MAEATKEKNIKHECSLSKSETTQSQLMTSNINIEDKIRQRLRLKPSMRISFEDGANIDLEHLKSLKLPSLRSFKYVKFYKEQSKRWSQVFLCEHGECDKTFKKWHNLFDHMRSHTQERPFECPVDGCS